ncbi:hypothetical protein POM88_000445 [Heracleum sosnowskyi]|uniref:Uncharacterized protein n=1 Tax=Heracleum sosnowskyi TaxID=360622 RepID=A0AAD8JEC2_9APIA|nr:hypothetical protein POM88_000445 [Heracleum sosnowskyi]
MSHALSWLIGRHVKNVKQTNVSKDNYEQQLTSKIRKQLEDEMEEKLNKKVQQNMRKLLKKLGEANSSLYLYVEVLYINNSSDGDDHDLIHCGNEIDTSINKVHTLADQAMIKKTLINANVQKHWHLWRTLKEPDIEMQNRVAIQDEKNAQEVKEYKKLLTHGSNQVNKEGIDGDISRLEKAITKRNGVTCVKPSVDFLHDLAVNWVNGCYALPQSVVYFEFNVIKDHALHKFSSLGFINVFNHFGGVIVFRFRDSTSLNQFLRNSLVTIECCVFNMKAWHEYYPFNNVNDKVRVWVCSSRDPFLYWTVKGLCLLGLVVGNLIAMEQDVKAM